MRTTTLLALAALLSSTGRTLAQNTPDENNPNLDAPFVRNIRADGPGQTISAQVLRPGRFQLETGWRNYQPGSGLASRSTGALLRIGFFNSMELRVSQGYQHHGRALGPAAEGQPLAPAAGWLPLVVGAKLMASPNYDTRTQVAVLVESPVPGTGAPGLVAAELAPAARLLVSEQIGQRFGLEANFGFSQTGLSVAALERGPFMGALALNGPLGPKAGFFVEAYGSGRAALATGGTAGLYWRPAPALRFDLSAGRGVSGPLAGSSTVGAGLILKLGR